MVATSAIAAASVSRTYCYLRFDYRDSNVADFDVVFRRCSQLYIRTGEFGYEFYISLTFMSRDNE